MRLFIIICFCSLFFSCERRENLEFPLPFEGAQYVVYGTINSENETDIQIYKTDAISTDSPDFAVSEDFTAYLITESGESFSEPVINGKAKIQNTINPGDSYIVKVENADTEISSENVFVPELVEISDTLINIASDSSEVEILFEFLDPDTTDDTYGYAVMAMSEGSLVEKFGGNNVQKISDKDYTDNNIRILVKQDLIVPVFNGFELIGTKIIEEVIIKLYRLSPEIVDFDESIKNNSAQLGNQFSEQNPPFTNLSQGYGYVGAITVDSIVIDLR